MEYECRKTNNTQNNRCVLVTFLFEGTEQQCTATPVAYSASSPAKHTNEKFPGNILWRVEDFKPVSCLSCKKVFFQISLAVLLTNKRTNNSASSQPPKTGGTMECEKDKKAAVC